MKLVKNDLHNKMGDGYLSNAVICYVENATLAKIETEKVMERFQKMSMRRGQI